MSPISFQDVDIHVYWNNLRSLCPMFPDHRAVWEVLAARYFLLEEGEGSCSSLTPSKPAFHICVATTFQMAVETLGAINKQMYSSSGGMFVKIHVLCIFCLVYFV